MSAVTVFVLIEAGDVTDVSLSISAQQAMQDFAWSGKKGEVYACQMSESAAGEVYDAFQHFKQGTLKQTKPITLVKRYSNSMMKCADVT